MKNKNYMEDDNYDPGDDFIPEQHMALMFLIAAALFGISCLIIMFIKHPAESDAKSGEISIEQNDVRQPDETEPDEAWVAADNEYYETHDNMAAIVDEDEQLSAKDFLPTLAHFIKSQAIGSFLSENGYECEYVCVVPGSAKKEGNNSYFELTMDEYPHVKILVTYHGITEDFDFQVVADD